MVVVLNLSVKVGETVLVGTTRIRLLKKSGQLARLAIDAERDVAIMLEKKKTSGKGTDQSAPCGVP